MAEPTKKVKSPRGTKKDALRFVKEMRVKGIEIIITGYSAKGKRLWEVPQTRKKKGDGYSE